MPRLCRPKRALVFLFTQVFAIDDFPGDDVDSTGIVHGSSDVEDERREVLIHAYEELDCLLALYRFLVFVGTGSNGNGNEYSW